MPVAFQILSANWEPVVHFANAIGPGDSTDVLGINGGNSEVTVQLTGTIGGATVRVEGSLDDVTWSTVDDGYGVAMSYTALGVIKPVGPAVVALRIVVVGGAGTSVNVLVMIGPRQRPS